MSGLSSDFNVLLLNVGVSLGGPVDCGWSLGGATAAAGLSRGVSWGDSGALQDSLRGGV